jgi:hypothetical protein
LAIGIYLLLGDGWDSENLTEGKDHTLPAVDHRGVSLVQEALDEVVPRFRYALKEGLALLRPEHGLETSQA